MTEDTERSVADVLRGAAQYIRNNGWFACGPNARSDGGYSACALVAIGRVADDRLFNSATHAVCNMLGLATNLYPSFSLAEWNNNVCRDGEEAAQTLEKAAAHWEETHEFAGAS